MEKVEEMLDIKMPPKEEMEIEIKDAPDEEHPEVEEPEEEEEVRPPPREIVPDEEVFKDAPQVKKVKRKCSEKQLQHLAKCREKALAKKKEAKEFQERQKAKQKRYVEQERREAQAKPKPRRKVQVKPEPEYEEEDFPYEEPPQQNTYQGQEYPEIFHKLTASEIRAIQKDAINDYEVVRKERKQKKRLAEQQAFVESERRKVMGMMNGKSPNPANDPWASAFSF